MTSSLGSGGRSSRFSGRSTRSINFQNAPFVPLTATLKDSISKPNFGGSFEFVKLQRTIFNKLGYLGMLNCRIFENGLHDYSLASLTILGSFMYWILHFNVVIKSVFLCFRVTDSSVGFPDYITTLDYILCAGLVGIGGWQFTLRYPFYEILQSTWKILNSVYRKAGFPAKMQADMERLQKIILAQHIVIIYGGCTFLMIQYFPSPKYVNYTYSSFELDVWPLKVLFAMHEFCFMMMSWHAYAGPSSMLMYEGIAISKMIDQLNETLRRLYRDEMSEERVVEPGQGVKYSIKRNAMKPRKMVPDTEYDIDGIIFDYRQLMLISERFNHDTAYKSLAMHIGGVAQFVADVYSGTHVWKLPGTVFMDVFFYCWDSISAGFMLLRVYQFMGLVYDSSEIFLGTLKEYFTFRNPKSLYLKKVARTLRIVTLKVGPCPVMPETLFTVLDTMGNYYICAALW